MTTPTPNAPKAAAHAVAEAELLTDEKIDRLIALIAGCEADFACGIPRFQVIRNAVRNWLAAAPQQVAEPVAWMFPSITGGHVFYEGSARPECAPERAIPLYAAPPSQASATGEV